MYAKEVEGTDLTVCKPLSERMAGSRWLLTLWVAIPRPSIANSGRNEKEMKSLRAY